MGMPTYEALDPTGWSDRGTDWLPNPGSHLARMNFVLALVSQTMDGVAVDLRTLIGNVDAGDAAAVTAIVDQRIFGGTMPADVASACRSRGLVRIAAGRIQGGGPGPGQPRLPGEVAAMPFDPSRRIFLKGAGAAAVGLGFAPSTLLTRAAEAAGVGHRACWCRSSCAGARTASTSACPTAMRATTACGPRSPCVWATACATSTASSACTPASRPCATSTARACSPCTRPSGTRSSRGRTSTPRTSWTAPRPATRTCTTAGSSASRGRCPAKT